MKRNFWHSCFLCIFGNFCRSHFCGTPPGDCFWSYLLTKNLNVPLVTSRDINENRTQKVHSKQKLITKIQWKSLKTLFVVLLGALYHTRIFSKTGAILGFFVLVPVACRQTGKLADKISLDPFVFQGSVKVN